MSFAIISKLRKLTFSAILAFMNINEHPYPESVKAFSRWIYEDKNIVKVAIIAIGIITAFTLAAYATSSLTLGIFAIAAIFSCHVVINFTRHINAQEARS